MAPVTTWKLRLFIPSRRFLSRQSFFQTWWGFCEPLIEHHMTSISFPVNFPEAHAPCCCHLAPIFMWKIWAESPKRSWSICGQWPMGQGNIFKHQYLCSPLFFSRTVHWSGIGIYFASVEKEDCFMGMELRRSNQDFFFFFLISQMSFWETRESSSEGSKWECGYHNNGFGKTEPF